MKYKLFKYCARQQHSECASVNVFDSSIRCTCICHPLFPMQDGPRIPWWLAERIYEFYCKIYGGGSQSLERLAERGGFGWAEVASMWKEHSTLFTNAAHMDLIDRVRESPMNS